MIEKIILETLPFDTLIPLVYGLIFWSVLRKDMRFLIGYMAYLILFTTAISILRSQPGRHNLWLVNLCFPFDVCCVLMLLSMWETLSKHRVAVFRISVVYSILSFMEMWMYGADRFTVFVQPAGWAIVIISASYSLLGESRRHEVGLTKQPSFWISGGYILVGCMQITLSLMNGVIFRVSLDTLIFFHKLLRPPAGVLEDLVFLAALVAQVKTKSLVRLEAE